MVYVETLMATDWNVCWGMVASTPKLYKLIMVLDDVSLAEMA